MNAMIRACASALCILSLGIASLPAQAQVIGGTPIVTGGVAISPDGAVENRTADPSKELALMRRRLADAQTAERTSRDLTCISLPKVFSQAKALLAAGKPLPDELQYLGGLTQIQYVFVYPEQKDLIIAGPAEAWTGGDSIEPLGKISGRPVMHFFDLIAAMRTVDQLHGRSDFFGCSIDMPPNSMETSDAVARKYENRPTSELIAAMTKAMGPQQVRIIGTADNTRLALTMVAADYKLKRFTLGMEATPVTGLGSAFDGSRAAGCRFWFEPMYDPLVVSEDSNAYGLRGQRLQIRAGAQSFDTRGVTPKAQAFATLFTSKLPELVKVEPAFADLQNIADLAVVAALIRADQLDKKIGWDSAWCLDQAACPVPVLPVPRTAMTLAAVHSDAIASGGVAFSMRHVIARDARAPAKHGDLPASPPPLATAWQASWKPGDKP